MTVNMTEALMVVGILAFLIVPLRLITWIGHAAETAEIEDSNREYPHKVAMIMSTTHEIYQQWQQEQVKF